MRLFSPDTFPISKICSRLPAAKITQIKEFTPAAWARAKTMKKLVAQAA
jgi:hypothetical protein